MSELISVLLMKAGRRLCALPVQHVVETFRPLPTEAVGGAEAPILGLAQVRGEALPVVDLNSLLGSELVSQPGRYVSVRMDSRKLVLAVDGVLDVRDLDSARMAALPPLLAEAAPAVKAVASLDAAFTLVLQAARLLSEDDWALLEREAS